jgi:ribose/xylose/arabinose/galactoside ABC-type transport system permease subunit
VYYKLIPSAYKEKCQIIQLLHFLWVLAQVLIAPLISAPLNTLSSNIFHHLLQILPFSSSSLFQASFISTKEFDLSSGSSCLRRFLAVSQRSLVMQAGLSCTRIHSILPISLYKLVVRSCLSSCTKLMVTVCLTIAPAFLSAAIYFTITQM